jgi:hypothetical protein
MSRSHLSTILIGVACFLAAYVIGGFIAQHTEIVVEVEEHPIYTRKGFEIAMEQGFASEELLEITTWFSAFLAGATAFIFIQRYGINTLGGKSRALGFFDWLLSAVLCLVVAVGVSAKTECSFVQEEVYDQDEHVKWTANIFAGALIVIFLPDFMFR